MTLAVVTTEADELADLEVRKARGAFFTPSTLCRYIAQWAIRDSGEHVLEPSCGEAAFMLAACDRLDTLAHGAGGAPAPVHGIEVHPESAQQARRLVHDAGHAATVEVGDFFSTPAQPKYDAVIGNPPYVRYQDFTGEARIRSQEAALRAGVALTSLASAWAAYTVHAAAFLRKGGRLGLVLPAELMTVNYAADVRRFLLQRFASVQVTVFTERVFPGVLEEVVVLLADRFNCGPAKDLELHQSRNLDDLQQALATRWAPPSPEAKWTPSLMSAEALTAYETLAAGDSFTTLLEWGETRLGMVTGNNRFFTLSPSRVKELRLRKTEYLRLSPPGSRHLRGLEMSDSVWRQLLDADRPVYLFRPGNDPSPAAQRLIDDGEAANVHTAFKCKVRKPWWQVPKLRQADLLLTYMNADTPRMCTNTAKVYNLNSVHGFYLHAPQKDLGRELLSLASLNSMTFLGAETVGRAYGGGILKLEPREADRLPIPAPALVEAARAGLEAARPQVKRELRKGGLAEAASIVDNVLLAETAGMSRKDVKALRDAHRELHERRLARGANPRTTTR